MKLIKFKFPSLEENYMANMVYSRTLEKAIANGVMPRVKLLAFLRKEEVFTRDMENELHRIEKGELFKYFPIPDFDNDETRLNLYIERCIIEIMTGERILTTSELFKVSDDYIKDKDYVAYRELSSVKNSYAKYSAEGLAEQARTNFLVQCCVYDGETGKKFWTKESFENEKRKGLVNLITNKLVEFLSGFNQTVLRKISRHTIWRTRWISATKTGAPLFKGEISEWDVNKTFLCYWSNLLDNIYSSLEPPEEHIVNDDKLLDAWIEAEHRKHNSGSDSSSGGGDTVRGIFKTKINPLRKKEDG